MKYLKSLVLATMSTLLMGLAVAGTATATELTCNGSLCPIGTVLHGEAVGKIVLDAPFGNVECNATSEGNVTSPGSATTTPTGKTTFTQYSNCGSDTVHVLKAGSGETHTTGAGNNGNGIITSTGTEVTIVHLGFHCIFSTSNTSVGEFTGSNNTGGTARFDIKATIPRTGGSSGAFCGSSAPMTGSVIMTNPDNLVIH